MIAPNVRGEGIASNDLKNINGLDCEKYGSLLQTPTRQYNKRDTPSIIYASRALSVYVGQEFILPLKMLHIGHMFWRQCVYYWWKHDIILLQLFSVTQSAFVHSIDC